MITEGRCLSSTLINQERARISLNVTGKAVVLPEEGSFGRLQVVPIYVLTTHFTSAETQKGKSATQQKQVVPTGFGQTYLS